MNASKEIHNAGYIGDVWQRSFYDHIIRSINMCVFSLKNTLDKKTLLEYNTINR